MAGSDLKAYPPKLYFVKWSFLIHCAPTRDRTDTSYGNWMCIPA